MERFAVCLKFVLAREGGYVNHPRDRGGATNKGITQRVYDEWRERKGEKPQSVEYIGDAEVYAIYNEQYWRPVRGALLPAPLDLVMFDSAVNHGPSKAIALLQESLGVEVDSHFGPSTLNAMIERVAKTGTGDLADEVMDRRNQFYKRIVERDPTQNVFAKGWGNRLDHLREAAVA